MKITKKSDIQIVASIVCDCLIRHGIDAVLSGGAVVSIYTDNEYESKDLDFVSTTHIKKIEKALQEVGFKKSTGRYFAHPESQYFLEFPRPPLAVGNMPIKKWAIRNSVAGKLYLLTPTQSVMDRLAGYFHWNDKQNLDQALMIAKRWPIKIREVELWAKNEGESENFEAFRKKLLLSKSSKKKTSV